VKFEQPSAAQLITDNAKLKTATAGADIHCGFCGARNPAGAKTCSQCNADLTQGAKRQTGQVMGAYRQGTGAPQACPTCGAMNPENALRCSKCGNPLQRKTEQTATPQANVPATATIPSRSSKLKLPLIIGAGLLVVACIIVILILSGKTKDVIGTVQSVYWERSIDIQDYQLVSSEAFVEDIPSGADVQDCRLEYHHDSSSWEANATEVCGTPYTVDTGTGAAEVVQDCYYQVYEDYCSYTSMAWVVVRTERSSGSDLYPYWSQPVLTGYEQTGDSRESYSVRFSSDKGEYSYSPQSEYDFSQFSIGSDWILKINTFGTLMGVEAP
jgi:ribosomal protein L40E